jgi:PiT family inorganic phosphate transporter
MHLAVDTLSTGSFFFRALALLLALSFEFVNGFHDTANAVATVIYTHTLRPWVAVVWSGIWNLVGVLALVVAFILFRRVAAPAGKSADQAAA